MRKYLVLWYDVTVSKQHIKIIDAPDLPAAKHKAFQMLCDNSGDTLIDDVAIYEYRYTFKCKGEVNPRPNGNIKEFAKRDYYTGAKIKRRGKDNG